MNKLRPYLFWLVCGVVVLIELVLICFVSPGQDSKTPESAKGEVDGAYKKLNEMAQQAQHPLPPTPFNPLDPHSIDDLTNHYLATKAWESPLKEVLKRYSEQLGNIKSHLVGRSKSLHEKLSNLQTSEWYGVYEKDTTALLQTLYDAGCLKIVKAANANGGGGPPPGVGAPQGVLPAAPTGGTAADPKPDFEFDGTTRRIAGFETKLTYNDLQYDEYTLRYHIMDMIAHAIESASAANLVSPAAPNKKPSESRVKLFKTTFAQDNGADQNVAVVTIDLEGPLSSLLAAEAALEENKNDQDAVRAVIGGKLWRPVYGGAEALHVSSEPVDMELQIAFLDFSDLENMDTNCVPQPKAAPAPKGSAKPSPSSKPTAETTE